MNEDEKRTTRGLCRECGITANVLTCLKRYGRPPKQLSFTTSSFYKGICTQCGEEKAITEERDFFFPETSLINRVAAFLKKPDEQHIPVSQKTLPDDILGAKFGTKNRSELILRVDRVKEAVSDIFWMARRYANGRRTYAPSMFNDAYDVLRQQFGDFDRKSASDQQGNTYHDITIEHTKEHPYALDGHDEDSQMNQGLKNRKFYPKNG